MHCRLNRGSTQLIPDLFSQTAPIIPTVYFRSTNLLFSSFVGANISRLTERSIRQSIIQALFVDVTESWNDDAVDVF